MPVLGIDSPFDTLRTLGKGGGDLSGQTIILVAAGQSNMTGFDTVSNVDASGLDAPISRAVQYMNPLGAELLPGTVASGDATTGWTASACTMVVENGRLKLTSTSMSNPRISRSVTVDAAKNYLIQMLLTGVAGSTINTRIDSPQTQRGNATSGPVSQRFAYDPSGASATLYAITQNSDMPVSSVFYVDDISVKEILAAGSGSFTEFPHRDAMDWPDAILGTGTPVVAMSTPGVSPASNMARRLIARGASKVIIIPCAVQGTKLVASPAEWGAAGTRYLDMIAKLTDAVTTYPTAKVMVGWVQGESDAAGGVSKASYKTAFTDMVTGIRVVAPTAQIIIGSMVPEYISGNAPVAVIDTAHQELAAEGTRISYVAGPSGYGRDANLHYLSAGCRILGTSMGSAALAA